MKLADKINSVARALALDGRFRQLTAHDAEQAVSSAERKFVTAPGMRWWWAALNTTLPLKSIAGSVVGYVALPTICPDQEAWLFASDDELSPWPVFVGRPADIAKIIGECHYFEYLVVSPSLDWAVIENHDNTFFAIGEPVATQLANYAG